MKLFATITALFISGIILSQNSYYFKNPVPSKEHKVENVETIYFGKYKDGESMAVYEFNNNGVYITSMNMSSMPKKVVRESSAYTVRDGYIHGVVEGDSLPCILEKGVYYFGIHNRVQIVYSGSLTTLTKVKTGQYILNFYEDGAYMPMKLSFQRSSLTISDFDYDQQQNEFDFIENQSPVTNESQNHILLAPSEEEFAIINNTTHFVERSSLEEFTE